jgi:hypothetical protein
MQKVAALRLFTVDGRIVLLFIEKGSGDNYDSKKDIESVKWTIHVSFF